MLVLDRPLPPAKQHLPREMRKAGYQTAMIGKWHLTDEPAEFDYYKVLPGQGKYFNPDFIVRGEQPWPRSIVRHRGHSIDVITDLSIDWLEQRDRAKPFFLMHHYKAPHDMFEFAPRYGNYLVYCLNLDANPEATLNGKRTFHDLRRLLLDPPTLAGPLPDDSVRPGGTAFQIKAWREDQSGLADVPHQFTLKLTEFADPGGELIYQDPRLRPRGRGRVG